MNEPNFKKARNKASEILLLQDHISFPLDVEKIIIGNKKILFSSYKNYSLKTNISLNDLTINGVFNDAMVINYSKDTKIVLYNSEINSKGRILWSKAHELGHIVLEHEKQNQKEEIEADTFASQLLLPQCLLKELIKSGVKVTINYLTKKFGLSTAAATSCIRLVRNKLESNYDAEYDDIIISKCSEFIKNETRNSNCDYLPDEYMDNERNNWLYDL